MPRAKKQFFNCSVHGLCEEFISKSLKIQKNCEFKIRFFFKNSLHRNRTVRQAQRKAKVISLFFRTRKRKMQNQQHIKNQLILYKKPSFLVIQLPSQLTYFSTLSFRTTFLFFAIQFDWKWSFFHTEKKLLVFSPSHSVSYYLTAFFFKPKLY